MKGIVFSEFLTSVSRNCWTRTTTWKKCSNAVMIAFIRQKKPDETELFSGKRE